MICPQCGKDNPQGAQQCASCGAILLGAYQPPRTSGLAVASLVLSLLCVFAPVGLVLGIIALVQMSNRRNQLTGSGFAIAGICVGAVITLVGLPILLAGAFPVFARARESARKTQCLSNVQNISVALTMYMSDWDETLPPQANRWEDVLPAYTKSRTVFVCPDDPQSRSGYAFMGELAGKRVSDLPDPWRQVSVFESDRGWNAFGDLSLLPTQPRHLGGDNFGYVDGHVKWVRRGTPPGKAPAFAPAPSGSGH